MKKQQKNTGHNKATKRKNSDEDYDSDQAYLERYKKSREEILKANLARSPGLPTFPARLPYGCFPTWIHL